MISFIILNYNSSLLTVKCIDSIVKQMPADSYEIVVVDNGSRPEEYDLLAPFCQEKHCCLVRQAVNTGFGTGNMIGASVAQGDYLCFLNSDVVLVEDCVTPLCQYMDAHPNVGCMTPVQQKVDSAITERKLSFKPELDIRGERLSDALDIVTHYIDDAIMLNVSSVRIIHGKGTGVLREEIQKYLRTIPGLTVSDEDIRNGGTGVTIVKL